MFENAGTQIRFKGDISRQEMFDEDRVPKVLKGLWWIHFDLAESVLVWLQIEMPTGYVCGPSLWQWLLESLGYPCTVLASTPGLPVPLAGLDACTCAVLRPDRESLM